MRLREVCCALACNDLIPSSPSEKPNRPFFQTRSGTTFLASQDKLRSEHGGHAHVPPVRADSQSTLSWLVGMQPCMYSCMTLCLRSMPCSELLPLAKDRSFREPALRFPAAPEQGAAA